MNHYPRPLVDLIKNLTGFPGIGAKSAERMALHILRSPRRDVEALSRSMVAVKEAIRLCSSCFSLSDGDTCGICRNPSRDGTLLCVVEHPADMVSIEKSGAFNGRYHILQGALSPMDGIGPDNIRVRELLARATHGAVEEIILATSTTVEGEATAAYLAKRLKEHPVKVTRIASGVPMGGDLKYVDQVTLKRAMHTRHTLDTDES